MTSKIADHLRGDHVVEVAGEGAGEPQDGVVLLPRVAQVLDQSEVSTGGSQPITAHLDLAVQLRVHRAVGLAQPLVQRLPAALVGRDGPVPDQSEAGVRSRDMCPPIGAHLMDCSLVLTPGLGVVTVVPSPGPGRLSSSEQGKCVKISKNAEKAQSLNRSVIIMMMMDVGNKGSETPLW